MRCRKKQGGRESGVCASSGSMVAPSVARVSTECGVRTRKADVRWCMCWPRGPCACSGTVTPPRSLCPTPFSAIYIYIRIYLFLTLSLSGFWTGRGHRCRPFFPRFLPSIFIAHTSRVQQSHCSSIFHQVLLTHALAPSVSQFVHKKKSPRICTSVHSAGLELTKLTYTRLEDNLIRHRGDRTYVYVGCASCLWLSSGSCCVPKGCGNDCSEGIRNMTARSSMHAI